MSQTYFAILTAIGEAKLANAAALGTELQLTQMAVGDGNGATPQPSRTQTALVHENRRGPLNSLFVDPANPSQIVAEHIIPEDVGGWWIRELGLYDAAGDLCAVANCPDTYKPVLASGSGRIQTIRMVLIVSNTSAVQLKIDPSIVLAPRGYVDQTMANHLATADPHPQYLTSAEGDTKIAAAVTALVNASPSTLDTLAELAAALGNDPNFATAMTNALAGKVGKDAQGNVGIGVAPKTWDAMFPVIQMNAKTAIAADVNSTYYGTNWYRSAGVYKRLGDGFALQYHQDAAAGKHIWKVGPNGVTDSNVAWTAAMTLDAATGLLDVPAGMTAGTPNQFDNSTRGATTAFVRKFGMQASGIVYPVGTVTLDNTAIGATVIPTDGSVVTLPAANSVPAGARIEFVNTGSGSYSIARGGTNDIILGLRILSSLTLYSGDTLILESNGGSVWLAVGGSVLMPDARVGKQIAKAWVSFNGTNGAIRSAFNVSSVTRNGAGDYTINFTSPLADSNFSFAPGVGRMAANIDCIVGLHHAYARNTANVRIGTTIASQANTSYYQDMSEVSVVIFGN